MQTFFNCPAVMTGFRPRFSSGQASRPLRRLAHELNTPSMANMIEGGKTPLLNVQELQGLGYSVVAYPCGSIFTAAKAVQGWARYLKTHGTAEGHLDHMLTFDEYFQFIGARDIREREKQFVAAELETTGNG